MKKLYALILCVLLVAVLAVTAFAAEDTKITVTPSETTAYRGDKVTVTINLSNTDEITAFGYIPFTNSAYYTIGKRSIVNDGKVGEVKPKIADFSKNDGLVLSAWIEENDEGDEVNVPVVLNGDIATFEITIKEDAPFGEFEITDLLTIKNGNEIIPFDLVETKITVVCKHEYGDRVIINELQHRETCGICGDVRQVGHNWDAGRITTEPTCKDMGVKTYTCTDCGATKTEDIAKTNDHTYGKWMEAGTEHTKTCSVCGDVQKADHVWDAGRITTEPTCKDMGVKTYTCTDCGATKTEDIAKTNDHAYGKWTEAGTEHTKTCSVCGDVQKADHAWDNGKVTTEPTCKDMGVKTYTCADCGASKIEPVATTDDHVYGACTKVSEEEHTHTCSVCGKEELLPHDYEEGRCVDCGAYQFWRYIIEEGKVIITKYVGPGGEVEILDRIEELEVIAIAEGAFEGCGDITGISIPKTVKRIAKAFAGCDSLKKVNITDMDAWMAMEFADAECNPLKTAGALYLNGELVTEVKISGTVGDHVFTGCTELKSVIIAEDVEGIGEGTFDGCAGISNVYCQGDSQQMENLGIKENENLAAADIYCDVGRGNAGNFDGSEEVDDSDALYLLRYTLFAERYPVQAPPDVNNDGVADDSDALYLLRYTLFADRYPLYPGSMLSDIYSKD